MLLTYLGDALFLMIRLLWALAFAGLALNIYVAFERHHLHIRSGLQLFYEKLDFQGALAFAIMVCVQNCRPLLMH